MTPTFTLSPPSEEIAEYFTGKRSDFLRIAQVAEKGRLETLKLLIQHDPPLLHRWNSHGRTLLWEAARRGHLKVVKYLVGQGADVNTTGCYPRETWVEVSPYGLAKKAGREILATYLRENGSVVDTYTAAFLGDLEMLRVLLDTSPETLNQPHPQDGEGSRLLHYAISGGSRETVEYLMGQGANIEPDDRRLILLALRQKEVRLLGLLLRYGADARTVTLTGDLLHDRPEATQLLKAHGASILPHGEGVDHGWSPLLYACRGDKGEHPERVRALLDAGADVQERHSDGRTALHLAAKGGFSRVIEVLLEYGAEVDTLDGEGKTPLVVALLAHRIKAMTALLEGGADPNLHVGKSKETPLHKAMKRKDSALIQVLIENGAVPEADH